MQVNAKTVSWDKVTAHALGIFVTQEDWETQLISFDKQLSGRLIRHLKSERFKAKSGQIISFPTLGAINTSILYICGLGENPNLDALKNNAAQIAKHSQNSFKRTLALNLNSTVFESISPQELAQAVTEGVILGSYQFIKYKSEQAQDPKELEDVYLLVIAGKLQHTANGIKKGELWAKATNFARDLVNESPSVTTPKYLAEIAAKLQKRGQISVEILGEREIHRLGMHAFLAVSRGSSEEPQLIKLTYKGERKKLVIAGKAITFDTGGLSLKDAKNMETMKLDMAGGAAVLGVFSILSELAPKNTVVGLIAACENMPGSKASKPGDVVRAFNGKSIEILNTDAEGRLTLADVLSYAVREKPDAIVDLATLTGACMVALGEDIAGLFVNEAKLKQKLIQGADKSCEKIWELPLEKTYAESIKSHIADFRNISTTRYGGAITAALFLQEFVEKFPWAHLDIAGPAYAEKDTLSLTKGATGFGVRTILNLIESF